MKTHFSSVSLLFLEEVLSGKSVINTLGAIIMQTNPNT